MWRSAAPDSYKHHAERHRREFQVRKQPFALQLRQRLQDVVFARIGRLPRSFVGSVRAIRAALYATAQRVSETLAVFDDAQIGDRTRA